MADPVSLVLSPIVERIIESAASLVIEEFVSVHGVKKNIQSLKDNLGEIKDLLQDAENKQSSKTEALTLRRWLGNFQNAAYDAEDILEMFETETFLWKQRQKVRKIKPPFSASKFCFQSATAHKIKEISVRIENIRKKAERELNLVRLVTTNADGESYRPTSSFFNPENFCGRESDKEYIIKLLVADEINKDGEIAVIPIVGMPGIGKTTLAQSIFNDERVKKYFPSNRFWVHVTVNFNLPKILVEIIESSFNKKLASELSLNRIGYYFDRVLSGERYLLVLDDVWIDDYKQWDDLWGYLKRGGKGSKILVTSQRKDVSRIMGAEESSRHLENFSDEHSWCLFKKIVFKDGECKSKNLEDIGREIVGKCKGLPLAVMAMGGMLRGYVHDQHEDKWKKVLESPIWKLEGSDSRKSNILPALKLSYDHLPSYLKQCFVFCSLFRKGYAFDKDELVKLWTAQKFIHTEGEERKEVTGSGSEYFDELEARQFFQVQPSVDKDRYKIHDLIHDLAQSIARSSHHYCFVEDEKPCSSSEESRHVSLLCKDVEQPALKIVQNSKKLRTLLLQSEYSKDFGQALKKIFDELTYLRLLDLSSSMITELPSNIGKLKLLCFLDLSRTKIETLPNSICNLSNLQTLKLLRCLWLIEFPKDLTKLVNLSNLEVDEFFWFTMPTGIGKVTVLHNLHAFYFQVGREGGYGIEELKNMANLRGRMHISKLENAVKSDRDCKLSERKNLEKLILEWSDRDVDPQDEAAEEQVLEGLRPHSNLKELQICHYQGARFPTWMTDGPLQNLVSVSLTHCTKCKILSFSQLPRLKQLNIKGMQELEKWQDLECPSLTNLKISNCPKLIELLKSLLRVRVLKIKKCNSLKSLPVTQSLEFLVLVDNLGLEDWNKQRASCIQDVKIINCPKLPALPHDFSSQKLEISGCKLLISNAKFLYFLFITNISTLASFPKWPLLPRIKALYIRDCRELVSLSEEVEGSFVSLISLKLLSIQSCPKLVKLPDGGLPAALEFLNIGSCHNLESLGVKGTLTSLSSLEDFYIEDCPKIHCFPEDGLPTSLQRLYIKKCPHLTKRCQNVNGEDPEWLKIKDIRDLEIDSAQEFPKKKESSAWCHPLVCSAGMKFKGEMEPGESSSSAQSSKIIKSMNFKTKKAAATIKKSQLKKTWMDKKSGYNCFMLYPMSLSIAWSDNGNYWSWNWIKESTDEYIEVAELKQVCWLDVRGKMKMSELSPGVVYEIVYVVKLTIEAYGWEKEPVVLRLSPPNPNGKVREHEVFLYEKVRRGWTELSLGKFLTENE